MFTQIFCTLSIVLLVSAGLTQKPRIHRIPGVQKQNIFRPDLPPTKDPTLPVTRYTPVFAIGGLSNLHYAVVASPPPDKNKNKKDTGYILQKVKEWRTATLLHNPGEADRLAREIGGWHQEDLEIVLNFITDLASQPVKSIQRTVSRTPIRSRLQLTAEESRQGELNRVLKQGALLHTDIAILGLETGEYLEFGAKTGLFVDGRVIDQPREIHWTYARRLIDSVSPSPSQDNMVRQWYIATIAYMQSRRLLAYAKENIARALDLFPSDDRILFYAGVQHETWALPASQNAFLPPGGSVFYGSKKSELAAAEKLYRKALKTNPESSEARLRLGRVLLLQGNPHQSFVELSKAAETIRDPQLSYYSSLYLGRALEMLSRQEEAREQYELAAALYPTAQSPLLALSRLARSNNDREGAILAVQRVFELPLGNVREDDPWWIYDLAHVRDAEKLVQELQKTYGALPR